LRTNRLEAAAEEENVAILLVVMAVKRYAFTSLWCAYAAIASVIILAYFWKSHGQRPFRYAAAG
jgi:hypothetical protein